jgi:hypothetical protein
MSYKYLLPLLAACAPLEPAPVATPETTPEPTPVPCPTPSPTPEPRPTVFYAPDFALVNTPFTVTLCEPFEFNVGLTVDGKPVGTFGKGPECSQIIVPGFSGLGKRTLRAKDYSKVITIFDSKIFTAQ